MAPENPGKTLVVPTRKDDEQSESVSNVEEKRILWFNPHHVDYYRDGKKVQWRSRQHRKGKSAIEEEKQARKEKGCNPFKIYDISWWSAFWFLVGSMSWVVNGIFVFHEPITAEYPAEVAEATTSFIGGTCFLFGGWAMYWEALNIENSEIFDEAVRKTEKNFMYAIANVLCPKFCSRRIVPSQNEKEREMKWKWIGWRSVKELGFMANFNQYLGTQIFWISVLVFLPGILPSQEEDARALYIIFYWVPQVIGAFFLIVSSVLITLEAQPSLWRIKPLSPDWHVGFWNIWGSVGFFLSGLFGIIFPPSYELDRHWGVAWCTYIGSYSFLLGTVFQYYEACT